MVENQYNVKVKSVKSDNAPDLKFAKLGGAKEAMTTRRNLEENGRQSSKIDPKRKEQQHSGQKDTQPKPSPSRPAPKQQMPYDYYKALQRNATSSENTHSQCNMSDRCKRSFLAPEPSPPPSSSNDTQGLGH